MKLKGWIKLVVSILILVGLGYLALYGPAYFKQETTKNEETGEEQTVQGDRIMTYSAKYIKGGMDFSGGKYYVYKPKVDAVQTETPEAGAETPETTEAVPDVTNEQLQQAKNIMVKRLNQKNVSEYNISINYDNKTIRLEMPETDNSSAVSTFLALQGNLQLTDMDGKVWIEENDIKEITASLEQGASATSEWYVTIKFTEDGQAKFAEASKTISAREPFKFDLGDGKEFEYPTNVVNVCLDGTAIQTFSVTEELTEPQVMLGLGKNIDVVKDLISLKGIEKLPFNFEISENGDVESKVQLTSTEPTTETGAEVTAEPTKKISAQTVLKVISAITGIIGLFLVFMLFKYKLGGIVSMWSFLVFTFAYIVILSMTQIPVSFINIISIILSFLIAMTSLIIIYETMNKELKIGKSLKGAILSSDKKAIKILAIIIIICAFASAILYLVGPSTTREFATLLAIGLILNILMYLYNKFTLNQFNNIGVSNTILYAYGTRKKKTKEE